MSGGVERFDITITPLSKAECEFGPPCSKCGSPAVRRSYSDVEIMGQRRAIMLQTCDCDLECQILREAL